MIFQEFNSKLTCIRYKMTVATNCANRRPHKRSTNAIATSIIVLISLLSTTNFGKPAGNEVEAATRHENEQSKDFAPKLIHQPQSVYTQLGTPLTIDCPVESEPDSEVKWFKDDQMLVGQPLHLEQTQNELMFFQTNDQDTGDYQCQATNYLGSITSEPFRLTVQSSVREPSMRLEPELAEAQPDTQTEFTCIIPKLRRQQRNRLPESSVAWRRNGKRLDVKWLAQNDEIPSLGAGERRFFARQRGDIEFVIVLTRTLPLDDNATFSCLYRAARDDDGSDMSYDKESMMAMESNQAKLRLVAPTAPTTTTTTTAQASNGRDNSSNGRVMQLDVNLAPAIDNLSSKNLLELQNRTSQLDSSQANRRKVNSLRETLEDLYEIVKPTLALFGLILLIGAIILLQFVFFKRRSSETRYMKHHYAGSGGSGTSSALGGSLDSDPVMSSLLQRTLSAPSAASLGSATKRYRSYRDHMRKVGATSVGLVSNDLVDGYFNQQQQQPDHGPFIQSALPNLYNQSLAAREQARSLLQASEHMRSLSNLSQLQRPNQQQQQQQLRAGQNGSHLNLPLSFALRESVATNRNEQHCQLDGSGPLMASVLWPSHLAGVTSQMGANQRNQTEGRTQRHYQFVNCPSVSPSSGGSDELARNKANLHEQIKEQAAANHYSTIETNDEDDQYEELDRSTERRDEIPRGTSSFVPDLVVQQPHPAQHQAFTNKQRLNNSRSSFVCSSNSSSSGRGTASDDYGSSGAGALVGEPLNRFAPKRSSANKQEDNKTNLNDQLSPYAVSSICGSITSSQLPPINTSDAMRALNEQFDINQLMLLDEVPLVEAASLPFDVLAPPPPPPVECPPPSLDGQVDARQKRRPAK